MRVWAMSLGPEARMVQLTGFAGKVGPSTDALTSLRVATSVVRTPSCMLHLGVSIEEPHLSTSEGCGVFDRAEQPLQIVLLGISAE